MGRILVIEHGPVGSAADIISCIKRVSPNHEIEATDPEKAAGLISTGQYDAVFVDANGHPEEAAYKTARIPRLAKFTTKCPVIFVTSDLDLIRDSKDIVSQSWSFSSRNPIQLSSTLRSLFMPEFRKYKKA